MSGHQFLNPAGLAPPRGFSHGAVPAEGRTLYIAGQTGHHEDMTLDDGLVEQFAHACGSVAAVIDGSRRGSDRSGLDDHLHHRRAGLPARVWARSGRLIVRCSASISRRWPSSVWRSCSTPRPRSSWFASPWSLLDCRPTLPEAHPQCGTGFSSVASSQPRANRRRSAGAAAPGKCLLSEQVEQSIDVFLVLIDPEPDS